ncbi:MAG: hypothetical protein ACI35S_02995 [Anaeroplasma sp.]
MDKIIKYGIIILALLIITILIIIFINKFFKKKQITKMTHEIEGILNEIVLLDKENTSIKKMDIAKKDDVLPYDYILETKKYRYYIKIVLNSGNQEICVNNSVKWQLRKSFNDESLRFVPNIEELMRLDIPTAEDKKINKKLFLIYPNARSLLKYINECEMEFVHPNTDVYGSNIITFINLKEHLDIIKL